MDILNLYRAFRAGVDRKRLRDDVAALTALELPQTYSAHRASAAKAVELARAAGLDRVEAVELPEDGVSVFRDLVMPYAWEATLGRLTVVRSPLPFPDPVIADYARHPFHLMAGSPSLAEGGEFFRLVGYKDMLRGADIDDHTLVLLPPDRRPCGETLRNVLELGAAGVVCDCVFGGDKTPDSLCWFNGNTPSGRWGLNQYDPPYLGFGVTPRTGAALRRALELGEVTLKAESDGRNFAATLPAVTGVLKGEDDREIWLTAHLYEPLADDNSAGVLNVLEVVKMLRRALDSGAIPPLHHTLRVVFARELYGFAAFHSVAATGTVIGALNVDSSPIHFNAETLRLMLAPPNRTFPGNALMRLTAETVRPEFPTAIAPENFGFYVDDAAPSGWGAPTIWPIKRERVFWHNSIQTVDVIDFDRCAAFTALIGAWCAAALNDGKGIAPERIGDVQLSAFLDAANALPKDDPAYRFKINHQAECFAAELRGLGLADQEKRISDAAEKLISECNAPENPDRHGVWFDLCGAITIRRCEPVLPQDMALDPDHGDAYGSIYRPVARIIANAAHERGLDELIAVAEAEGEPRFGESELKRLIADLDRLGRFGYLDFNCRAALHIDDLRRELERAGIAAGDVLLVHSALGAAGPLADGAGPAEINDMLLRLIGESGTLLMPAFTRPYIYFEGAPYASDRFRPHSPEAKLCTGALAEELLTRPNCVRDAHLTHSVAGIGSDAAAMLAPQGATAPPTGIDSVWPRLAAKRGKMLFLGPGVGCATMLHYLETELDLPYLGGALVRYRTATGVRSAWIEKHLGGCRDFYRGIDSRFFRRARERGLKIVSGKFGVGEFHLIDAKEFYDVAKELLTADPGLLLCEDPACSFCVRARGMLTSARR